MRVGSEGDSDDSREVREGGAERARVDDERAPGFFEEEGGVFVLGEAHP